MIKSESAKHETGNSNTSGDSVKEQSSFSGNRKMAVLASVLVLLLIFSIFWGATQMTKKELIIVHLSDTAISAEGLELVAHRGFSAAAPENSIAAFRQAGEAGFDACEFDIHATTDGKWAIMHDDDISRMTNGKKTISQSSYEEISEYVIDNGSNVEQYPGQTIPTLEDALNICMEYGMTPFVEIKSYTPELLNGLSELIGEIMGDTQSCCIISFDEAALKTIRENDSDVRMCLLTSEITDENIASCEQNNFGLSFNHTGKGKLDKAKAASEKGIALAAWTVDTIEDASSLIELGVSTITTNCICP